MERKGSYELKKVVNDFRNRTYDKYSEEKALQIDNDIMVRFNEIVGIYGYPIVIGGKYVSFPEEYDNVFSVEELRRLDRLILKKRESPELEFKKTNEKHEIIKQNFIKEFTEWDRNDFRKTFVVATTSDAMRLIGIDDKEITLDAVKLNRIFKYHSSMNDEIIKQLPDIINEPVFILASKQKESRIVATGEVLDTDNNSVVVIMELKPKGKNDVELDEIKIASAYGKENIQNLIITSNMLYLTDDKEKINRWIKCTGLQLPFGSSTIDSTYIISQSDEKATNDLKEKQLEIIMEKNPAPDNYHTWITKISDILSFNEALNLSEYVDDKGMAFDPSYPYSIAENALETGKIMVYSSYPIEQGVFVTPSFMDAQTYAGGGQVYSKEVELSDVAWIDPIQGQYAKVDLKKGENKMGKDNPITLWVGNQRTYTEGNIVGEWINLPMEDSKLEEVLSNISNDFKDEMYIADSSFREDCSYLYDVISEYDRVQDINVVAKLIGDKSHPAVEIYLKYDKNVSMEQIANLLLQEDEINYFTYEFDGVDNPNVLNALSNEMKLGYTMIENDSQLKETLEKLEVDGISIMNYVNVEDIGRDMVLSGFIEIGDEGYLDIRYLSLDLEKYSIKEINQELEQEHIHSISNEKFRENLTIEKNDKQGIEQKVKKVSEPTPKGPKM